MLSVARDLKIKLTQAVHRTPYSGLLFSGGLDSAILAYLNPKVVSITVSLQSNAKDLHYAVFLAKHLNMKHFHRKVEIDEALEKIPHVIKILKSFDLALPNDLVIYFGLKFARDLGIDNVALGDGSDELFAGYSFMERMPDVEGYIKRISTNLRFSSNNIGQFFTLKIIQPFLDKNFIDYALKIPANLKIREDNGKLWGKWILRQAFREELPHEVIWQSKRPLEVGSGMMRLRKIICDKISDEEFRSNTYPIKFINKEHFYYYKLYREVVGMIPKPKPNEVSCSCCGGGIAKNSFHCSICGWSYLNPDEPQ